LSSSKRSSLGLSIRGTQEAHLNTIGGNPPEVAADTLVTWENVDYFVDGPTFTTIVEPLRGSLTILMEVLVSVTLTPASGVDSS
jgi:hypothetical protein